MPGDSTIRGFRVLAAVGCLALLFLVLAPFFLGYVLIRKAVTNPAPGQPSFTIPAATSTSPGMGDLGYRCGGTARLPCGAGLVCSTESLPGTQEGVCVKLETATPTSTALALQKEGTCQLTEPLCDRGYACVPQKAGAVCQAIDTASALPRVLAVKLDGMSPTDGVYLALPGTTVTVTVQASDALNVSYRFRSGNGGILEKSKGGSYSGTFVVPRDLDDDLAVIASSPKGASALWLKVASVQ